MPGASEAPPSHRRRKLAWGLTTLVALAALAWVFTYGLDYFATEQTIRQEKKESDALDREGPAFTTSAREDKSDEGVAYLSNQTLSTKEVEEIFKMNLQEYTTDDKGFPRPAFHDLKRIMASHNGNVLPTTGLLLENVYVKTWLIDFFSDRTAGLAITDIAFKDLKCSPAAAKAVVLVRLQAGGEYSGIHFNLPAQTSPISIDVDESRGKPYFSHKKINLGNGAEPGGLRTEVSSGTEDCSFLFEAEYRDTKGTHHQEIRNGKESFHVPGFPANPEQIFVVTPEGVTDCGKRPWRKISVCPPLPFSPPPLPFNLAPK
ncbi:hypothetical protein OH797_38015 (plasmid) [Streptomyces anulatus]|uniref:hypothetical protein n=1 Tax=Streptomyces anulatus TaxID=1892 RepID=UPI002F9187EB|nr:hypothetical protein OG882_40040 [Streptomyces anulatus]